MTVKKRIIVVDDHPMFRDGVKARLRLDDRFEIVAEAGTVQEALRIIRAKNPDVVLLDISLPDGNGIELAKEIKFLQPDVKILFLSFLIKREFIASAISAGANGYIGKDAVGENLIAALDAILRGSLYIDSSIPFQVVKSLTDDKQKIEKGDSVALSAREQEILKYVAEGKSSKEIADALTISVKTVENHRTTIMTKLKLNNVVEMVWYAIKIGLIDPESKR